VFFETFNSQNLREKKIANIYMWFKVGSQKYTRMSKKHLLSNLAYNQIWLNLPTNDCHSDYITKLTPKKHCPIHGLGSNSVWIREERWVWGSFCPNRGNRESALLVRRARAGTQTVDSTASFLFNAGAAGWFNIGSQIRLICQAAEVG